MSKAKVAKRVVKEVSTKVEKVFGYKVLRDVGNGKLHSASVPQGSRLHKLYEPNKVTKASGDLFEAGYGLCIFLNLEDVYKWKSEYNFYEGSNYQLWKVEVGEVREPSERRPSIRHLATLIPATRVKDSYTKVLRVINKNLVRDGWPEGCWVTDFCIPTKRVK